MSGYSSAPTKEKDLLFLHGYLSSAQSFAYQTQYFSKYFNVYAFDMTGFGKGNEMLKPFSLDDYIEEVARYTQSKGIQNAHVIAHSFGARIVIKGVADKRLAFDKLVLTGAAGLKPKKTLKKQIKKSAFNFLKHFVKRERLQHFYSSDYLSLSPIMKESFKLIVKEHLDHKLANINNKTLLVFGKNDLETPLYMAKRLNKGMKNSSLEVINGAGHFCFIDSPLKFNMEVKEFLLS